MPRKQKKYHYIYKTTCIITGKFYIGMHSTEDLNDDYLGSGKRLGHSINKYGKDHHILEILEFCDNRKALIAREKEIVNEEMIGDCMCMNICLGGGCWPRTAQINGGIATSKKYSFGKNIANKLKRDENFRKQHLINMGIGLKKRWEESGHNWVGRKHKKETKKKIGIKNSIHQLGTGNSNYGKCWIYNLKIKKSMSIKKEELDIYLKDGWVLGRKMKFPF